MDKIAFRETHRPLILVTNDDGIQAKGIEALTDFLLPLGDIVVVAPDGARSGQSAAITSGVPLRVSLVSKQQGCIAYKSTGTPVDCIKLAANIILDRRPNLIVSGINHGSNAAVSVIYSGTMGAVMEGIIQGIPSIGFSLCDFSADADFEICRPLVQQLATQVLRYGLPDGVGLNVNIPAVDKLAGVRLCRAARGKWVAEYESRIDPHGQPYYWLTGYFENAEPENCDTDEYLLARGCATIVPVSTDRGVIDVDNHFMTMLGGEHPIIY